LRGVRSDLREFGKFLGKYQNMDFRGKIPEGIDGVETAENSEARNRS
jgi:hypothetical protein